MEVRSWKVPVRWMRLRTSRKRHSIAKLRTPSRSGQKSIFVAQASLSLFLDNLGAGVRSSLTCDVVIGGE